MIDVYSTDIGTLSKLLRRSYDKYADRHAIKIDESFLLLKICEELGELTHTALYEAGKHPKKNSSKSEEASDLLFQVLVYMEYLGIEIDRSTCKKWLSDKQT